MTPIYAGCIYLSALLAAVDSAEPAPPPQKPTTLPAQQPQAEAAADALARIINRPHTVAEIEGGIIALPTAPISASQRGGNTPFLGRVGRGDATAQVGMHLLYRPNAEWAFGASALFAPSPTSDNQYGGTTNLPRTHSRSYLFLGPEARYIPVHYKFAEAWVGASVGAVVVADRFTTDAGDQVPPALGTRDVTIRTEGLALGLQAGGSYWLSENWIAGAALRGYDWILPTRPRCSAIGDCSTLQGHALALELGLTIGYRLPL